MALAECADSIGDRYADLSDASNRIETALEDSNLTAKRPHRVASV